MVSGYEKILNLFEIYVSEEELNRDGFLSQVKDICEKGVGNNRLKKISDFGYGTILGGIITATGILLLTL